MSNNESTDLVSGDCFKLVRVLNPFDHHKREIEEISITEHRTLAYYLYKHIDIKEDVYLTVSVNGKIIDKSLFSDVVIKHNDVVIVTARPGWEGAVAAATWIASFFATSAAAYASTAYIVAVYAMAAVIYVGALYGMSQLMSALGPDMPDMSRQDSLASSDTYGWAPLQNSTSQGNPIPFMIGTHKVAGQVINEYVSIDADGKEKLHTLIAICGHAVDSITDIRCNGQPVSYFRDVTANTRLGSLNDTVISGFDKLVTHINFNYKLLYNIVAIQQTVGTSIERIEIDIVAPQGLYKANSQGGLDERIVNFGVSYRAVGAVTWINSSGSPFSISGATSSAVRKSILVAQSLSPDQYEIRVIRTTVDTAVAGERTDIHFTSMREIVPEALIYPGIAKYSVEALATDQLSGGRPVYTAVASRNTVQVFNPYLDGGNGLWETVSATNPAWATYAIINLKSSYTKIIYDDFKAWADWCDEDVGGHPRFRCNMVIDFNSTLWDHALMIAKTGRAVPLRKGGYYSVFMDKPVTTVDHMFTMGNIKENTFSITYLNKGERANAIEISHTDKDRDYTRQTVVVHTSEYEKGNDTSKKLSLNLPGVVDRQQIIEEGAYKLNCNKHLIRTVSFGADVDSFTCTIGDVFYFQHAVPNYKDTDVGGRILDAWDDTTYGYIKLEAPITLKVGQLYVMRLRHSDTDVITAEKAVEIVLVDTTSDTVKLSQKWITIPKKGDLFALGAATTFLKRYRLIDMTKSSDFSRKLTGLEYIEEVYDNSNFVYEVPIWDAYVQTAVNVILNEYLSYNKDGSYKTNINVSWNPAYSTDGISWNVWLEDFKNENDVLLNKEPIKVGTVPRLTYAITQENLVIGHTYKVYISAEGQGAIDTSGDTGADGIGSNPTGNIATIKILGKLAPPEDVAATSFIGTWDSALSVVNLFWQQIGDIDLQGYKIQIGDVWDTPIVRGYQVAQTADGTYDNTKVIAMNPVKATIDDFTAIFDGIGGYQIRGTELSWLLGVGTINVSSVFQINDGSGLTFLTVPANFFTGSWASDDTFVFTTNPTVGVVQKVNTFSVLVPSHMENGTYKFLIKAFDTSGVYSSVAASTLVLIERTAGTTTLQAPTNLTVSTYTSVIGPNTSKTVIEATWDANAEVSPDFSEYDIYIDYDSGTQHFIRYEISENNRHLIDAIPNKTYVIRVRAVDDNNNSTAWVSSTPVSIVAALDSTPPADVTNVQIAPYFRGVVISWNLNPDTDILEYKIERSHTGAFAGEQVLVKADVQHPVSFYVDAGLDVATEYWYRVKAVDTSKNSSANWSLSVPASVVTLEVDTGDIALNAVTANRMLVNTLSAINADLGMILSGLMQSPNWVLSAGVEGMEIDLDNETIKFGDGMQIRASDKKIIFGNNQIIMDAVNNSIIVAPSGGIAGNDYAKLTDGEIGNYIFIGIGQPGADVNGHMLYKSINRQTTKGYVNGSTVLTDVAEDGDVVILDGYWNTPPKVRLSPYSCQCFDYDSRTQSQRLSLNETNVIENSVGSKKYQFTVDAKLLLASNVLYNSQLSSACSSSYHMMGAAFDAYWNSLQESAYFAVQSPNVTSLRFHGTIYGEHPHISSFGSAPSVVNRYKLEVDFGTGWQTVGYSDISDIWYDGRTGGIGISFPFDAAFTTTNPTQYKFRVSITRTAGEYYPNLTIHGTITSSTINVVENIGNAIITADGLVKWSAVEEN